MNFADIDYLTILFLGVAFVGFWALVWLAATKPAKPIKRCKSEYWKP